MKCNYKNNKNVNNKLLTGEELCKLLNDNRPTSDDALAEKSQTEDAKNVAQGLLEGRSSKNDDPKLADAADLALGLGKISTSLIQRRLSVGYGRAAKILDRLAELGIVSHPDGTGPCIALYDCRGEALSEEQIKEARIAAKPNYSHLFMTETSAEEAPVLPEGFVPDRKPCRSDFEGADELLIKAAYMAADAGRLNTSMLQKGFTIGYGRSARILDALEEIGVLAPTTDHRFRAVLVNRAELEKIVDEI